MFSVNRYKSEPEKIRGYTLTSHGIIRDSPGINEEFIWKYAYLMKKYRESQYLRKKIEQFLMTKCHLIPICRFTTEKLQEEYKKWYSYT